MKKIYILFLFCCLFSFFSCQSNKKEQSKTVTVTILPQQYFAEKIAGDKFKIVCMVPSGNSPESYEPAPSQLIELSNCNAYFQIGYIGFELAWMDKLKESNPNMQVFNTSDGITLLESAHSHSEDNHETSHSAFDPHTWSSPKNAAIIAQNMLNAFIKLDPANEEFYKKNYEELSSEIHQTDSLLKGILSNVKYRAFIIYHPALTYFAHDYSLTQLAIEHEGKEPSPAQLKELIDKAKELQVKVIFIQKEFDKRNAELIAKETGCKIVEINPLNYDWKSEMLHIANSLHVE